MKFLKGLALSILSFLLFLSISVFGLALALNLTVLNPGFVNAQVDKLDVTGLVVDLLDRQGIVQIPPQLAFVKTTIYGFISSEEPYLKEQVHSAVNSGYDYFLGKKEHISISIPLDALKGRLQEKVKPVLKQVFLQVKPPELVPPQLANAPQAQLEQYFETYFPQLWQQLSAQIPDKIELNESQLPADALRQLAEIRQYVSYFQLGYRLLIALMLLLILGIVFLHRELKGASREIGIVMVSYGAFEYAGIFLAQYFLPDFLSAPPGIPASLWTWLMGMLNDVMSPLGVFSLVCLAVGVVLLVVSFIVKSQTPQE